MNSGIDARAHTGQQRFEANLGTRRLNSLTAPNASQNGHCAMTDEQRDYSPLHATLEGRSERNGQLRFEQGRTGDHLPIYHFLLANFQGPSPAEFQAQLDHPTYQAGDRLLIKRRERILAHAMVSHRRQHFGHQLLPSCELMHLATLPEYRGQGNTVALLRAAEEEMQAYGAAAATLRTEIPSFFERQGWAICGRHSYSTASPRDILAQIEAAKPPKSRLEFAPDEPITIRLWRHVEQDALMRIYERNALGSHGPLHRTHEYWRWLISRQAYDRIYVAIRGTDKLALGEDESRIIGYAVMKSGRIIELLTLPEERRAAVHLLARACGDAIERDDLVIRLDAAPYDPLHRVLRRAGGTFHLHEADAGEVFMARMFDPLTYLRQLAGELHQRSKLAGLARPAELGLVVGGETLRVVIAARSVRIEVGKVGRSLLACEPRDFTQLLLGHIDVPAAVACGRLEASTAVALQMAAALFPRLPWWRPPWDDLPAS